MFCPLLTFGHVEVILGKKGEVGPENLQVRIYRPECTPSSKDNNRGAEKTQVSVGESGGRVDGGLRYTRAPDFWVPRRDNDAARFVLKVHFTRLVINDF